MNPGTGSITEPRRVAPRSRSPSLTALSISQKSAALQGSATGILGATAYQVEEEPSNLFLSGSSGITEETTGARSCDPSGNWTSLTLPDTPATWADQVVLYAPTRLTRPRLMPQLPPRACLTVRSLPRSQRRGQTPSAVSTWS